MDIKTLKRQRFLAPGVLIAIFSLAWYGVYSADVGFLLDVGLIEVLFFPAVIVFATLYYFLRPRDLLVRKPLLEMRANIVSRIESHLTESNIDRLLLYEGDRTKLFMRLFYNIVDSDRSLSNQSVIVMSNGYVWHSVADAGILSMIFSSLFAISSYWTHATLFSWGAFILSSVSVFTIFVMLPRLERRHKELSDEQLDTIESFHRKRVNELADAALPRAQQGNWPKNN